MTVPSATAIPPKVLNRLVDDLTSAREGVVLFGGTSVTGKGATAIHAAVLLTNYLLGAIGKGMIYGQEHALTRAHSEKAAMDLLNGAAKGTPEVLFIYGANPAYTLPGGAKAADAIAKANVFV